MTVSRLGRKFHSSLIIVSISANCKNYLTWLLAEGICINKKSGVAYVYVRLRNVS